MSACDLTIGPGTRVTLHFTLRLPSGEEVDSTREGEPATFEVGDGNLPGGFEEALYGLAAGEQRASAIPPERAFGTPNPENVRRIPRADFPAELQLEEGLVLGFSDAAQTETPGVVTGIDEDAVVVDFNHPLAGRELVFDVRIIEVEPTTRH